MNRSIQECLRCIIKGNDTRYTEWSADVKLFPLAYNSQITTTLGMSPYEMVIEMEVLNRDKKHNEIYQKVTKKLLQRQNINEQINSRYTPASNLQIGTFVLIPNFNTQKGISKKLQPLRKGPYQIIAKPTAIKSPTQTKKKLFNIETIYCLTTQKNTHYAN